METIIIAVILLVLLAVLIFLFIGKLGTFGKSVSDCQAKAQGAYCSNSCRAGEAPTSGICPEDVGKYCCMPLETKT